MPSGATGSIGGCVSVFAPPVSEPFVRIFFTAIHFVFGIDFKSFVLFHFSKSNSEKKSISTNLNQQSRRRIFWLMQDCDIFVLLFCYYSLCGDLKQMVLFFVPDPLEKPLPACTAAHCLCRPVCVHRREVAPQIFTPTTPLATFNLTSVHECFPRRDILMQFCSFIQLQVTQERPPPLPWKFFFFFFLFGFGGRLKFPNPFQVEGSFVL